MAASSSAEDILPSRYSAMLLATKVLVRAPSRLLVATTCATFALRAVDWLLSMAITLGTSTINCIEERYQRSR